MIFRNNFLEPHLPAQGFLVHSFVSTAGPRTSHLSPFASGVGLSHWRLRDVVPTPHVALQVL